MNIQQCYTRKNMKREKKKKQTTSLCLSTYFNIFIRVLLLIKTFICRILTMCYTPRHGKKKTDDITDYILCFTLIEMEEKKEQTTSLCLSTFFFFFKGFFYGFFINFFLLFFRFFDKKNSK